MKKKVLFIIGTLQSGGVSKSLVSLLNAFDRQCYDVHLLLLTRSGDVFSKYLPKDVTLHANKDIEDLHDGFAGVFRLLKRFRLFLALGSIMRMVLSRIDRARAGFILAKLMPCFSNNQYDLIVDYGGQQQLYYMVDKLNGKKKISFFHNDYSKWPYYYKTDKKYYPKIDYVFSISQVCVDSLKKYFPDCKNKIGIMENISSPQIIYEQAKEPTSIDIPENKLILATLGHLCIRKGWDYIIEAASILKRNGVDFIWLQIGKIIEKDLVNRIKELDLINNFIFTGIQQNPYPYLKACDIYVHPSRFEGKSIALDEAKILCKPIVVTDFSTVHDQFTDRENASICSMSGEAISNAIIELMKDDNLRQTYVSNLSSNVSDNSGEVKKLYWFLDK